MQQNSGFSKYYSLKRFHLKLFLFINIIAAASVVVSYSAIYMDPEKFWIPSFFGLAFPYLIIVNLFFIITWLIIKRIWFLISLVSILSGMSHLNEFVQFNFGSESESNLKYKVMTYNVRLFDLYNWGKNWSFNKKNRNNIIDLIKNEKPELICFQEFFNDEKGEFMSSDSLAKKINLTNYHQHFTTRNKDHLFGIATFSKFPIVNKQVMKFKNTNNICIYSDIVIDSDTVRVINCHLASIHLKNEDYRFVDSIMKPETRQITGTLKIFSKIKNAFIKRSQQAKALAELIKNTRFKIILCGDFNDSPISYTYHTIKGSLEDSFQKSGSGTESTYTGFMTAFRIDYILHSNSIKTGEFKVIREKFSDHFPVICKFSVN